MTTIAQAYVQLLPSMRGFSSSMNAQMGGALDKAGRDGGKSFGSGLIGAVGPVLLGLGAAAAGGLAAAGVMGVKTAAAMEQSKISFTTMLGSAQKAETFLAKLADFAAKTPFDMPGLQTAASSLISAGINADKVIPIMTTLGNVTSGMGTGAEGVKRATVALQQMQAAGKITGEDLNQLRDAGIPVYDLLAAATGKSKDAVVELANKGKLGRKELDQLMSALESGKGMERFAGLMEAQSQSLEGMMSTLQDELGMGLAKAVQPLMPLLKDGLGKAATFLGETAMPAMAKGIQFAVTEGTRLWQALQPLIGQGQGLAATYATQVQPVLAQLGGWVQTSLIPALQGLADKVNAFVAVALPIIQQFASGMQERLAPLMPTVMTIFGTIGDIIVGAMNLIGAIIGRVTSVISYIWANWGTQIMDVTAGAIKYVTNILQAGLTVVSGIIRAATALFNGDWSGAWRIIQDTAKSAMESVKAAISGAMQAIGTILGSLRGIAISALSSAGSWLLGVGRDIVGGIAQGIRNSADAINRAIQGAIGDAIGFAKRILGIASPSRVMRDQIGRNIGAGIAAGVDQSAGLIDRAMGSLGALQAPGFGFAGAGSGGGYPGAAAGGMPRTAVLQVGERAFSAYLREISGEVVDEAQRSQYDDSVAGVR